MEGKRYCGGGAKHHVGTYIPVRAFKRPVGVSRLSTIYGRCRVRLIRSTTRDVNDFCGNHRANAFKEIKTVDFGNGGAVAANNKNVLLFRSRRLNELTGRLAARTGIPRH